MRSSSRWLFLSLATSAVLNVALGALLTLRSSAPPVTSSPAEPSQTAIAKPIAQSSRTPARSFHWSQLESDDFDAYVASLRAIGCPEATINNIVKSEIAEIYMEKRKPLERALQDWERGESSGTASRASLKQQLAALSQEETSVVSQFLRTPEQREVEATQIAETQRAKAERTADLVQAVQIPLALWNRYQGGQSSDKKASTLPVVPQTDDEQAVVVVATVAAVQQEFAQDLAATSLAPQDPGYAELWIDAQVTADERLRTQIGHDLFHKMHLAAGQAEQQARAKMSANEAAK